MKAKTGIRHKVNRPELLVAEEEAPKIKVFEARDWEEILGPVPRCGGRTRSGMECRLAAGYGTEHPGYGRCMRHDFQPHTDAKGPLALYLDPELRSSVATFVNSEELLNLRVELAVLRVRFAELNNLDLDSMESKNRALWSSEIERLSRAIREMAMVVFEMERGRHKYLHINVTGSLVAAFADVAKTFISPDRIEEFLGAMENAMDRSLTRQTAREIALGALTPDIDQYRQDVDELTHYTQGILPPETIEGEK